MYVCVTIYISGVKLFNAELRLLDIDAELRLSFSEKKIDRDSNQMSPSRVDTLDN